MDSSKHTPLPWRAEGQQIVAQENDYCVAVVSSPHPRARGKERMEDLEYCRGNTAFIVTACSAYYGMLEDLNEARTGWEQATEVVREAEEVLAKERALRERLAEALQEVLNEYVAMERSAYCQVSADDDVVMRARTALAAAEAA